MRRMLTAKLQNRSGVLNRFTGVLSRRQVNIESISVGATENPNVSRITIIIDVASHDEVEQIIKQLNKLIEVVKVTDLNEGRYVERELSLVKIKANSKERRDFLDLITIYEGVVVDISTHNMTVELTGSQDKINAFIEIVGKEHILEIARTGTVGLGRGERVMSIS